MQHRWYKCTCLEVGPAQKQKQGKTGTHGKKTTTRCTHHRGGQASTGRGKQGTGSTDARPGKSWWFAGKGPGSYPRAIPVPVLNFSELIWKRQTQGLQRGLDVCIRIMKSTVDNCILMCLVFITELFVQEKWLSSMSQAPGWGGGGV